MNELKQGISHGYTLFFNCIYDCVCIDLAYSLYTWKSARFERERISSLRKVRAE